MKKLSLTQKMKLAVVSIVAISVLAACSNKAENSNSATSATEEKVYNIGITQIVDHAALNQVRDGFDKKAKELGINATMDSQNAQGDIATSQMIAEKFVSDNKDLILAISTPSAQSAQNATQENNIPVLFAAVSDPVSANLVDENMTSKNITGVSDKITKENIKELLEIANDIKPDKKTIGVIYNVGEANSISQVDDLKIVSKEMGLEIVEVGISTISDIDQAMEVVSADSDTLFLISDNLLASSMGLVTQKAKDKGMITVSTVDTFVDEGALLSIGVNYEKLGEQVAVIAKQVLIDKVDISTIKAQDPIELYRKLNENTATELGLDISKIKEKLNK